MTGPEQKYGSEIECWALAELVSLGYGARLMPTWTDKFDILIEDAGPQPVRIEVKGARATNRKVRPDYYRPTWEFDTARLSHDIDHVVIMVVEDDTGRRWPFVCPNRLFIGRGRVNITSHPQRYGGMFAEFLGRWGLINEVSVQRARIEQLSLPGVGLALA